MSPLFFGSIGSAQDCFGHRVATLLAGTAMSHVLSRSYYSRFSTALLLLLPSLWLICECSGLGGRPKKEAATNRCKSSVRYWDFDPSLIFVYLYPSFLADSRDIRPAFDLILPCELTIFPLTSLPDLGSIMGRQSSPGISTCCRGAYLYS